MALHSTSLAMLERCEETLVIHVRDIFDTAVVVPAMPVGFSQRFVKPCGANGITVFLSGG